MNNNINIMLTFYLRIEKLLYEKSVLINMKKLAYKKMASYNSKNIKIKRC